MATLISDVRNTLLYKQWRKLIHVGPAQVELTKNLGYSVKLPQRVMFQSELKGNITFDEIPIFCGVLSVSIFKLISFRE